MSRSVPAGFITTRRPSGQDAPAVGRFVLCIDRARRVVLLNLPPDRRGRIHDNDVNALRDFRSIIDATFATNLAAGATISASNSRAAAGIGGSCQGTSWMAAASPIGRLTTTWDPSLTVEWPRAVSFNVVRLREYLPLASDRVCRAG